MVKALGTTKRQHELLVFIDNYVATRGFSPSYDEMKDALGLASKSGIHRLVKGLEERKLINRLPDLARCVTVNYDTAQWLGIGL